MVYVGLSGGVDSSVAAALLTQQGYKVVGVYMKNWSRDLPGLPCPWKDDYQDAKRVAVQLGIDFKLYDFEKDYQHKVVDYMLDGFKAGPDLLFVPGDQASPAKNPISAGRSNQARGQGTS